MDDRGNVFRTRQMIEERKKLKCYKVFAYGIIKEKENVIWARQKTISTEKKLELDKENL